MGPWNFGSPWEFWGVSGFGGLWGLFRVWVLGVDEIGVGVVLGGWVWNHLRGWDWSWSGLGGKKFQEFSRIAPNHPKPLQAALDHPRPSQTPQIPPNILQISQILQIPQIPQIPQNSPEFPKITRNLPKFPKVPRNSPKFPENGEYGSKLGWGLEVESWGLWSG